MVYSDAIAAHGFAHELANYGEYSGAPTEGQTCEYAMTIINLLPCGTPHPEGKILIICGGIANFTNVAATFKGITRALKEYKAPLIAHNVILVPPVPMSTEVNLSISSFRSEFSSVAVAQLSGRPEGDAAAWRISRCAHQSLWP